MVSLDSGRCLLHSILYIRDIKLLAQIHIANRYMHELPGGYKKCRCHAIRIYFVWGETRYWYIYLKKTTPRDSKVQPGLRPPLIDGGSEILTQLSGSQAHTVLSFDSHFFSIIYGELMHTLFHSTLGI